MILDGLGKLYHSYRFFGVDNQQYSKLYELNQIAKEPVLIALIAWAIGKGSKSFTELFCADGYYAMVAARLGCRSIGIDNDKDHHFKVARAIAATLNVNVDFVKANISPDSVFEQTDIVANAGGLYHVSNPKEILKLSYGMAKKYLIVQSVVSMATDDISYYKSPAPGWSWGCRFSRQSFDKMIKETGYKVIDQYFNELTGNKRKEDRGSVYYLIEKC
jgi:hypothetical protein